MHLDLERQGRRPHRASDDVTPAAFTRAISWRPAANCGSSNGAASGASGCLKYWPPGAGRSSTSTHLDARLRGGGGGGQAAGAGTDHQQLRRQGRPLDRRPPRAMSSSLGGKRCVRTASGPSTLVMQARWFAQPSISTRQSWQTPMPQNRPRGAPRRVVRKVVTPAAARVAASVSPRRAASGRPSKVIVIASPAAIALAAAPASAC